MRYNKYKVSGIEWLGEVPDHWYYSKLKYEVHLITKKAPEEESIRKYVGLENIEPFEGRLKFKDDEDTEVVGESLLFNKGDVLFGKLRPYLAKCVVADFSGRCTSELLVMGSKTIFNRYLFYLMLSDGFLKIIDASTYGAKMPRASWDFIGDLLVCLPPVVEQRIIAEYLDSRIEKIDEIISAKQKQIDLLQQQRQAVISEAVTKGLDKNVPMKDSGIEWIREIPESWKLKKIKYLAFLKSGNTITSDKIEEQGQYPVYGGNGLRGYTSEYTHEGSYVLIGRQGALCGNVNYANGKFWASEHAVVVTAQSNVELFWFGELLRTMKLNQYSISAAQPGLSVDMIQNLIVPAPSLEEQISISRYMKTETDVSQVLILKITSQITKFKEYRQSLIYEAVTGKIKVS